MSATNGVYVFAVAFFVLIRSAHPTLETVWLKEVTTRSQTDKRAHRDANLPDELVFHLRRSSETISLKLKRNHDINPNADFYFAQKSNNGEYALVKSPNWETEEVAYYQDLENAAFVIVRCVQESNTQCERIINGHMRIRDTAYELLPASKEVNSRKLFEVSGRLGKQYILKYPSFIQRDVFGADEDAVHVNEDDVKQELKGLLRRFRRQDKEHQFPPVDASLSTRNVSAFRNRQEKDVIRELTDVYYIKVAVVIDASLWDFYSSMVPILNPLHKRRKVMENIRRSFSHIMNGVSTFYKGIEDPTLSFNVILSTFIVFKNNAFQHEVSKVERINGTKYIDITNYLIDIKHWDKTYGVKHTPPFHHGMFFTRYLMYKGSIDHIRLGSSYFDGICIPGERTSVVEARGLFWTAFSAAHELGHNLGAEHDKMKGSDDPCDPRNNFIMSTDVPDPNMFMSSKNPWLFSSCSVSAFLETLEERYHQFLEYYDLGKRLEVTPGISIDEDSGKFTKTDYYITTCRSNEIQSQFGIVWTQDRPYIYRDCFKIPGDPYDPQEYQQHVSQKPGVVYNVTEQCRLIIGRNSRLCETAPGDICHAMRCTCPATGHCYEKRHVAVDGTECGENQWCIQARCVPKDLGA